MGLVVDEGKAKGTPCNCIKIDEESPETPENLLCFSEGVVGALSDRQDSELCSTKSIRESPALQERLRRFKEIGAINDVCLESEVSQNQVRKCFIRGAELLEQGLSGKKFEEQLAGEFGVEVD